MAVECERFRSTCKLRAFICLERGVNKFKSGFAHVCVL